MQDKNLLVRSHIKAELLNYLDVHPHNIQLGISDVADLALSVGKLLSWLGAHLDADDIATRLPMERDRTQSNISAHNIAPSRWN